jgi:uncharacterized delta-60 repeat protein
MKKVISVLSVVFLLFVFVPSALAWKSGIVGTQKWSAGEAYDVKIDGAGNVIAAGSVNTHGDSFDFTVMKLNAAGNELWRVSIPGGSASAVAVDSGGSIVAVGNFSNIKGSSLAVVKFDASGKELWRRTIDPPTTYYYYNGASAVSFDGSGNIVIAGSIYNGSTDNDFFVVKYDANGNELWRYLLNGPANSSDGASDIAVDSAGNVIAVGSLVNHYYQPFSTPQDGGPSYADTDFTVVKLNGSTGAEMWRQVINGKATPFSQDFANAVAVDNADDVFAVGAIFDGVPGTTSAMIVKFDGATGREQWRGRSGPSSFQVANAVTLDATGNAFIAAAYGSIVLAKYNGRSGSQIWEASYGQSSSTAYSVALDNAGNLYAAGQFPTFGVIKVNGLSGAEIWRQSITANGQSNVAVAVAVDGTGNPVAAGVAQNFSETEATSFTVQKLNGTTGAELWRKTVISYFSFNNAATRVIFDGAGDVFAAGFLNDNGTREDFAVAKFSRANGEVLWMDSFHGSGNYIDTASAIAVDGSGDFIAAGFTYNASTGGDFTVVKYNGATGAQLWRRVIDGGVSPNGNGDGATAVGLDAAGNIFAAGMIHDSRGVGNFALLKLDAANGATLWTQLIPNGYASALAVDGAGNVVVVGTSQVAFAVVKYNGATGAEMWRQLINGTAGGPAGQAVTVAIDASGNVVAGGYVVNSYGTPNTNLFKFNGMTGAELWRQSGLFVKKIAVDGAGNVAASGLVGSDLTLKKYDGTTGTELWRHNAGRTSNTTIGLSDVAVDTAGNIFTAGGIYNAGSRSSDILALKLDGPSGSEIWRQEINGGLERYPYFDQAFALALDGTGNIAIAGTLVEMDIGAEFALVMLNGGDGSDFLEGAPEVDPPPPAFNPPSSIVTKPLAFGAMSLPDAEIGLNYTGNLQISGGVAPYYVAIDGVLPPGLTIDATGVISGTPVQASKEPSAFAVQVLAAGYSITRQFSISVYPAVTNATKSLKTGAAGKKYSSTFKATGGKAPYTWSLVSGSLPAGLTANASGTITGTPGALAAGTYNPTFRVTDALGGFQDKTMSLIIK